MRLYRGEIHLPTGLVPLSPFAQQLVRGGFQFANALALTLRHCTHEIDSPADEQLLSVADHSAYYRSDSPFVSATSSLVRALQYATSFGRNLVGGYINVLEIDSARYLNISEYAHHTIASYDRELAIPGWIAPDEIIGQISVGAFSQVLPPERWGDVEAIANTQSKVMDNCTPFTDSSGDVDQRCPVCGFPLQAHVASRINPKDLMIELPIADGTRHPTSQVAERRIMCNVGLVNCCHNCKHYLISHTALKKALTEPVAVKLVRAEDKRATLTVENTSNKLIQGISIRLMGQFGEKHFAWTPPPADLIDPAYWPYFAPEEVHTVELEDDELISSEISEVSVMGVRYEDGLGWVRISNPAVREALQHELLQIENS